MRQKHRCGDPRPASLYLTSPPSMPSGPPSPARVKLLSSFVDRPVWCAVCGLLQGSRTNYSLTSGARVILCRRCLRRARTVQAATVQDLRAAIDVQSQSVF
ncbi:MAG TPA: hypothetical protein VEY12_05460 [Thermoplasmata archaeon]|nr:hypothetical protein [Thermoplasmata archaeon]